MQYDKLELLKYLCISETPVTLKSFVNTFIAKDSYLNTIGCMMNYKYDEKTKGQVFAGVSMYESYHYRQTTEPKPFIGTFEIKIKGLVYKVDFTTAEKAMRTQKKNILGEEEILISKIHRTLASSYESLVLAEIKI